MRDPFISIIIPTLNEEQGIGKLLNHLAQCCSKTSHEIIIADGGSEDQTVKIAKKMGASVYHCNRKGRAAQMNQGAAQSRGEILYFLHADTFPPLDFMSQIVKSIKEGHKSGCFKLRFDDRHPLLKFYGWCTRFKSTLFRFGDQSLFVKKKQFQKVKGFDESMVVMEDQKIVRELKKQGSFEILDRSVITSARRYRVNGIIRLQFAFTLILILYYMGISQDALVHVYKEFIHPSRS